MKDQIFHSMICDGEAAMLMISSSNAVSECKKLLGLNKGMTMAAGRLINAGALLAQRNKSQSEKLTIIVNGGGPAGKMLVTADNEGNVKASFDCPAAQVPAEKISISELVGKNGQMTVIRDNPLGEPYVGVCNLVSGDITRDFAAYLVSSEQQPAAVALDCIDEQKVVSGGIMVMPMPGCSNEVLDKIDSKISSINDLTQRLEYHLSLEEMAYDMFWDVGVKPLETLNMRYWCDCSRERFLQALVSLGKKELLSLAYGDSDPEILCRFCGKKYIFSRDELKNIAKELK